jgi:hypothetical protein
MARVVPSIVIAVIDRTFPWAKQADYNSNIRFAEASNLAGIVDLLDRLPNELLTLVARGDLEARKAAVARAAERVPFKQPDPEKPESWDLIHYIEVARELGEISESTASEARLAKDFRNLIHPGRERRPETGAIGLPHFPLLQR